MGILGEIIEPMIPAIENIEQPDHQDKVGITAPNGERPWPEFIPLPSPRALCPWSGCTRSFLNTLILPTAENGFKPPVRSVCIRKRGRIKGKRLIIGDSLRQFLWNHIDDGSIARERHKESICKSEDF